MRLFEILLLAVNLPFILWAFLPQQRPFWLNWLPVAAAVLTIVHLLIEKGRWQMFPAYLLTAVLLLLVIRPLLQQSGGAGGSAIGWGLLGLVVWGISLALPIILPVPTLSHTTGPYQVGTTIIYLKDEARPETYSNNADDKRELMAQIWYPATDVGSAERATYLPKLDEMGPVIAQKFGLPPFLLNHINLTRLDIFTDAPVAATDAPFPVIIFSHGLGGIRMQNTRMVAELASHGYVVAAVDHTYASAITVFPDNRVIVYEAERIFTNGESNYIEGNPLVQQWAADINFLREQMSMWNEEVGGRFNGRLNTESIGVFGHSTGGGTAVEFCLRYDHCAAGVGLDSWVLPVTPSLLDPGLTQPFMFINTPRWLGPDNASRGRQIFNNLPQDAYLLTLANTGHYDFSDLVLLSPLTPQLGLSGSINSAYSLDMQTAYLLAFFDQYLKGEAQPLLQQPPPYPELSIETRRPN